MLIGGAGDDVLQGGAGDDTYIVSRGDGNDTVQTAAGGGADTLAFQGDVAHDQLWFARSNNDLIVSVIGQAQSVTVTDWYASAATMSARSRRATATRSPTRASSNSSRQ